MTTPKLVGILPLRNGVKLGYPFELAIRSLQRICPTVVVSVDPTSEDETEARVRALNPSHVYLSTWNMHNHNGMGGSEIATQTMKVCDWAAVTLGADWILSLQADEVLHEKDVEEVQTAIQRSDVCGYTLPRLYFYGGLHQYRTNWTVPLLRLFRPDSFGPDFYSGAMTFVPKRPNALALPLNAAIYHYSRVGDVQSIALRVRNLDTFYHDPSKVLSPEQVSGYDFSTLRKLDTYVRGTEAEADEAAALLPFDLQGHPVGVVEYFNA